LPKGLTTPNLHYYYYYNHYYSLCQITPTPMMYQIVKLAFAKEEERQALLKLLDSAKGQTTKS